MNYTKGPWLWLGTPGRSVLNAAGGKILDYEGYENLWPAAYDERIDASNMTLIAAAPDLYEALKRVVEHAADDLPAMWEQANAALARAEGK